MLTVLISFQFKKYLTNLLFFVWRLYEELDVGLDVLRGERFQVGVGFGTVQDGAVDQRRSRCTWLELHFATTEATAA